MAFNVPGKKPAETASKFQKPTPAQKFKKPEVDEDESPPPKKTGGFGGKKSKSAPTGGVLSSKAWKDKLVQKEAEAEARKAESDLMWRFFFAEGEERTITFLDGELDDDNQLDIRGVEEHRVKLNGNWRNIVCTMDSEGFCPACDGGDKPALRGFLTIIDHHPHKIENGPRKGEIINNERKIFAAPISILKKLTAQAIKRGGLTGCTYEVTRSGDKSPAVGSDFEFVEKLDLEDLAEKYGLDEEGVSPANYDEEIVLRTSDELIALGVGKAPTGPGFNKKKPSKKVGDEM